MKAFQWNACFITGLHDVDEQHHRLVDLINRFGDSIEVGGLILCKTPEEFVDQRSAYYNKQTQAQTEAVDNSFMKENDARMPLFKEKRTTTSFGKGK